MAVLGTGGTIMNAVLGNPLQVFGAIATGERLKKCSNLLIIKM